MKNKIETIRRTGQKMGLWTHGYGYPNHCKQIFNGLQLEGKRILEIGCGKGLLCIWAGIHGAEYILGLEPMEKGSGSFNQSSIYKDFRLMANSAALDNVDMLPQMIQDYQGKTDYFDIVLMVASVNHIFEEECIQLHKDESAREKYIAIFKRISVMMKKGGKMILIDCSNRNFFPDFGLKNPFVKSIEWFKHQSPECWAELLGKSGFEQQKLTWPSGRFLGYIGCTTRPKIFSYFIDSTFRLEMTCGKG